MSLLRYPEKIPADKRLHFMIGTVFTAVLYLFTSSLLIHIPLLAIVSWGIEYYQKHTKSGQFDHWDAIAVLLGGLVVIGSHYEVW
jgi:hypothetical protein